MSATSAERRGRVERHDVVIIGGGPQGVEFASFWRAYGVEVTVVELLPHLVPGEDEEVSRSLERAFAAQSIGVRTGVRVQAMQRRQNRLPVRGRAARRPTTATSRWASGGTESASLRPARPRAAG